MPDQLPANPDNQSEIDARLQAIQQRADIAGRQSVQTDTSNANAILQNSKPAELLSWTSESRLYDPKSPQWFLGLFAIGLLGVIVLAIFQEVILILLIAAAIFVYYALARVRPAEVEHAIFTTGIKSAGRMYGWKELRSFWMYGHAGATILRLDTKMYFPHTVELLLPIGSEEQIKETVARFLPLQEKAVSEVGAMADHALISVANKIPYRDKLAGWVDSHI